MKMFDIYYVDLSTNTVNSEQGGIRPCVIVQNNLGNKYSPTLIVIPLTSELKKINMPTHCMIYKNNINRLKNDSMVLAEQLRVVDKSRIKDKIGIICDEKTQNEVINAYLANITGKKKYNSFWRNIIYKLFKLVKEGEFGDAA